MTENQDHKLFTYYSNPPSVRFAQEKTLNLNQLQKEDEDILKDWFPVVYAKDILDGVRRSNIWLGIGKRGGEVISRWRDHPWLPDLAQIRTKVNGREEIFNIKVEDAFPITSGTIRSQIIHLGELNKITASGNGITLYQFCAKPLWRIPQKKVTNLAGLRQVSMRDLDDGNSYEFDDINSADANILVDVFKESFETVLPDLNDKWGNVISWNMENFVSSKFSGLCGAWYEIKYKYSTATDYVSIRVPIGLIKQTVQGAKIKYEKTSFISSNEVCTSGMDLRFICEKENNKKGKVSLAMQLNAKSVFLNNILIHVLNRQIEAVQSHSEKLMSPIEKFYSHKDLAQWQANNIYIDKKYEIAEKICPEIVGKEPLVIFKEDGIHLLNNENQIGIWCANEGLLDRMFCPPPWSNDAQWLDHQIIDITNNSGGYTSPTNDWPGGRAAIEDDVDGLTKDGTRHLISVLSSRNLGLDSYDNNKLNEWNNALRTMTIKDFRTNGANLDRMNCINNLWNQLTSEEEFNTDAQHMYDPHYKTERDKSEISVPSSWCPVPNTHNQYYKHSLLIQPWVELCIGFRIEGKKSEFNDTLNRYKVKNQGMTQWRCNPEAMYKIRKLEFRGTNLDYDKTHKPRVWNYNNDTFNETAICVSRNLFGATAFPERTSQGEFVLFAVDCYGLSGFDTENYQKNLNRIWVPGEKAFEQITFDRVIAWVCIERKGCSQESAWIFKIDSDANWTSNEVWESAHNGDSNYVQKRIAYISTELAAWRGEHNIPNKYDFNQTEET